jgi:hypothetical protein
MNSKSRFLVFSVNINNISIVIIKLSNKRYDDLVNIFFDPITKTKECVSIQHVQDICDGDQALETKLI